MTFLSALTDRGKRVEHHKPWPRVVVDEEVWRQAILGLAAGEATLLSLWSDGSDVHLAMTKEPGDVLVISLAVAQGRFPSVACTHLPALRLERAIRDLYGLEPEGCPDERRWLDHGRWGLRHPLGRAETADAAGDAYGFLTADGPPLHQIPVGPVHAGIIEPGHFRFTANGETVVRLEERLGYVHKGIDQLMIDAPLAQAARLAGRISGDSTVAYACAFAQAVEAIAGVSVPQRGSWLRVLCLERERLANHLGDLGYLGNDAGFAFGLAQFSRLKEDVLRTNFAAFGHRLLMDVVVPGGVAQNLADEHCIAMRRECATLERELRVLRGIYDDHAVLQDRFRACGTVAPALAARLGLSGLAGRASGQARDLRVDFPTSPYDVLAVRKATRTDGDVAARVALRFDEVQETLRLIRAIVDALPEGDTDVALPAIPEFRFGVGYVEGWRGPVFVALETGPDGSIRRCHPHDVSWQNWPVLEHAVIGNIVPDFPLINKSFNLSYSGHDL